MRTRTGVFAFTSCEGCSLMIMNLEDEMLSLLDAVEFVNFREAVDEKSPEYDIAIIDGAITRPREVDELKEIRARARVLVAMGACAVQGGLYHLRECHDPEYAKRYVYGDMSGPIDVLPVRPVSHYVDVDHNIYGCPIDKGEFTEVLRSVLAGKAPDIPDYPVCNECRSAANICVFERGAACMGPVTRAGCGAICPAHATGCSGCRGLLDDPSLSSHREMLLKAGLDDGGIAGLFSLFNGYRGRTVERT